jgi:hypothetical protein
MAYNHDKGWCWYNTNNKINFIAIPKNASTSIRNGLNLKSMGNYFTVSEDFKNEYKNITVLRNPLERIVSAYLEVLIRLHDGPKTGEKKFFHMSESIDRFREFISELERDTYDAHVEPQYFYISDNGGNILPFYKILKFEKIMEDFKDLKDELKLKENLPHLNSKPQQRKNMVYSYLQQDPTLIERIRKIYEKDFELYETLV